jgi:outer membrane lipoprotein
MRLYAVLSLVALLLLSGCAHVISEENRKLADPALTFEKLRENPEAAIGKYALLGGMIVTAKNLKEGGRLEIVELKMDHTGFPLESTRSGGRFFATSPDFIDAMIFKQGRLVTVFGEVKGKKTLPIDEVDYAYPVIAIREIYPWISVESTRTIYYPVYPPDYMFDPYNVQRPLGEPLRR